MSGEYMPVTFNTGTIYTMDRGRRKKIEGGMIKKKKFYLSPGDPYCVKDRKLTNLGLNKINNKQHDNRHHLCQRPIHTEHHYLLLLEIDSKLGSNNVTNCNAN